MHSMTYKPAAQWSVENRHDAAADQDILLRNVGGASIRFEITADDAVAELEAALSHTVQTGRSFALQMKAGERLFDTLRGPRGHDVRAIEVGSGDDADYRPCAGSDGLHPGW